LEQELARVGAFSEQQVRDVLVEVLQILEFVHSKSVIHRDISPDNIIRRRSDKKLVLVDFGAAKHATATLLAKTGTGIGKPSYGAPEQMLGKSVFQSDLFGLGVTCLHLLTNVEPFTLYDVLENEYQWRQFLNGKLVSDEFGKLLDRMTAYRVKDRPSSVTDTLLNLGIDQAIELQSSKGINYRELEQLLIKKEWRKADELTAKIMCQITGREKEGWLTTKNIQDFPSADLERIDQLWMHYSNGKFGFSIQKKLWLECGGKIGKADKTSRKKFAGKVGWYHPQNTNWMTHSEFMNSTRNAQNALPASLPRWVRVSAMELSGEEGRFETLLSRKELLALEVAVTQNVAPIKNLVAVELLSEKWIDYRELEKLLKQKEWRKADEMTNMLMLRVCGRENEGFILGEHIASFPCQDLLTIDQLWSHYSDGKFGFTVQVKLCQEYCKFDKYDKSEEEAYKKFAAKVGSYNPKKDYWKTYDEFMEYTNNAQIALPASLPQFWLGYIGAFKTTGLGSGPKGGWYVLAKTIDALNWSTGGGLSVLGKFLYGGGEESTDYSIEICGWKIISSLSQRLRACNK